MPHASVKEGDLYEIISVGDKHFEIRYGYYSEEERSRWEPMPIFPDLKTDPQYTEDGFAIVTHMQDACEHYRIPPDREDENWCGDCIYYDEGSSPSIGICRCKFTRKHTTPPKGTGGKTK